MWSGLSGWSGWSGSDTQYITICVKNLHPLRYTQRYLLILNERATHSHTKININVHSLTLYAAHTVYSLWGQMSPNGSALILWVKAVWWSCIMIDGSKKLIAQHTLAWERVCDKILVSIVLTFVFSPLWFALTVRWLVTRCFNLLIDCRGS